MTITLPPWAKRLLACLFGGFVLALMVGNQEGTIGGDFGIAFRHAVLKPRIFVFLGLGVALFGLLSVWPRVVPYLQRPGARPLGAGLLALIAAQTVMKWYDPLFLAQKNGKFADVRSAVDSTPGIGAITTAWFDWLAWVLLIGVVLLAGAAVVTRHPIVGLLTAGTGLSGAVLAYYAHREVVHAGSAPDHSLGVYTAVAGYALVAAAGVSAVYAHAEVADTKGFVSRVMAWRPGLPIVGVGAVLGLFAMFNDGWFAPQQRNLTLHGAHTAFAGTGISALASQYLSWLGYVLFAAGLVLAFVATYLRHRLVAWLTAAISVAGVVLTFFTLKSLTDIGAQQAPQFGKTWQNLGVGGFVACLVFALFGAAMVQVLASGRRGTRGNGLPFSTMADNIRSSSQTKAFLVIAVAVALFYPPMLPEDWQNLLVTQIGVYLLLAVGLNVVVGWAGLLDLGYIAFYGIGSYTTAYFVGALPKKPPHWLHLSPLACIPVAILACLIAGVILGAPTLRLRGDYLAIVTLGFGEIITVVATNNPGGLTGGPQGPTVPHPRLNLFGIHIHWGQDNLPYWYLLLVMLVVVVVLLWRLEGSRLGRAWAAIREDEVAAQASGVNTTRVKLLAFAIGASTSGLAGVFFATQVGYFDPTLFTILTSILIVAYVVFGGMGSLYGALAGAAVLTWLPQFLKAQVPQDDRQMWIGAAVLAMMIFRPAGLFPARRRKAELEDLDSPASSEVAAVPASEGL